MHLSLPDCIPLPSRDVLSLHSEMGSSGWEAADSTSTLKERKVQMHS